MVIVVVLPFPQLVIEQMDIVGNATVVKELIELLVIDAVGPLDFPVQVRRSGPDVHVSNVRRFKMPVKL